MFLRTIRVVAAVVEREGLYLITQRRAEAVLGGLWEFPGGKVEPDETPQMALVRELEEELGIRTYESCLAPVTFASEPLGDSDLLLLLYVCRKWSGVPTLHHAADMRWVKPVEMFALPMPPADLPMIGVLEALI